MLTQAALKYILRIQMWIFLLFTGDIIKFFLKYLVANSIFYVKLLECLKAFYALKIKKEPLLELNLQLNFSISLFSYLYIFETKQYVLIIYLFFVALNLKKSRYSSTCFYYKYAKLRKKKLCKLKRTLTYY